MSWANLPYDFDGLDRPKPKVNAPRPAQSIKYVADEAAKFRARSEQITAEEQAREAARAKLRTERTLAYNRVVVIREYTSRGLTPVYSDPGETMPISLPFLLSIGWHIESDGMGRSWLVKPEPIGRVIDRGLGEGQQR